MIKNITFDSVYELLNICCKYSVHDIDYIKKQFEYNFTKFEENIDFLKQIGLVEYSEKEIKVKIKHPLKKDQIIKKISKNLRKIPEITEFLDNFDSEENYLVFKPSLNEIAKFVDVRKLLISFGFLEVNNDICKIVDKTIINSGKTISKDLFKKRIDNQAKIGEIAEKFVINFELEQAKKYPDVISDINIRQTSNINVYAGFDIESFDKDAAAQGRYRKIYIEVKAIFEGELKFYWSNNEILKAKKMGNKYYLYLVNVAMIKNKQENKITIISDPYNNIFLNPMWIQKIENISFKHDGDFYGE